MGDKSPKNLENDNKRENSKMIASEPVRSRWTPKPEQILVLEHIFNSGMVNPPKDETVRIKRLLEKFGPVGDANVFYWFQNRRSRSRRRQKQMGVVGGPSSGVIQCNSSTLLSSSNSSSTGGGSAFSSSSSTNLIGDNKAADNDLFTISRQMGVPKEQLGKTPIITPTSFHHLHYQPATVFINGVPSEVPEGLINIRATFGDDKILVHSSGEIVPVTEDGFLCHCLQMGESYFLISKVTL
ncbi:WUSCHEL-related homeobox [Zostera marina]|uniref:WUSCHEL-related homeobox n=1 Tax=Zostera marina TaxID=29655 RepID=A0A0K9PB66_ZOSMR|nr:WUSCHEL-related homeobox [Zostera marina]